MLTALTVSLGAELTTAVSLLRWHVLQKRRQLLLYGKDRYQHLPVIDQLFRKKATGLTKNETRAARLLAGGMRYITRLECFESMVAIAIKDYRYTSRPEVVRIHL